MEISLRKCHFTLVLFICCTEHWTTTKKNNFINKCWWLLETLFQINVNKKKTTDNEFINYQMNFYTSSPTWLCFFHLNLFIHFTCQMLNGFFICIKCLAHEKKMEKYTKGENAYTAFLFVWNWIVFQRITNNIHVLIPKKCQKATHLHRLFYTFFSFRSFYSFHLIWFGPVPELGSK